MKNTDDPQFGEHSWTFRHPEFHADRRDALENIKRKVPAARKSLPSNVPSTSLGRSASTGSPGPASVGEIEALQAQTSTLVSHTGALQNQTSSIQSQTTTLQSQTNALHAQTAALQTMSSGLQSTVSALQQQMASLQAQNDALRTQVGRSDERIRGLERSYRETLGEMVHFQRNMAQQDGLMQGLIQYFLGVEGGESAFSLLRSTGFWSLFGSSFALSLSTGSSFEMGPVPVPYRHNGRLFGFNGWWDDRWVYGNGVELRYR